MKQLQLVSYSTNYTGYDELKALLDACSFANVGVELSIFTNHPNFPGFIEELEQQKEKFAPYYISFHGPFVKVTATAPLDSPEHQLIVDAYKESFRICNEFQGHAIVMHTNNVYDHAIGDEVLRHNCITTIKEIGEYAKDCCAQLLVENVGIKSKDNVLFPMEEFIQMFDQLPAHIGCLIDVGHAFDNGWDVPELVKRLGSRIVSYHLHNNDGVYDTHRMMFEEGLYYNKKDWKTLFTAMEQYSPNADWILEYSPRNVITAETITNEIKEIQRMLEEIHSSIQ